MVENHVLDQLPAYILGTVDETEAKTIADHLSQCSVCSAELATYRPVLDALPLAVIEKTPAAQIKNRLLQRIQAASPVKQQKKSPWWKGLVDIFQQSPRVWTYGLAVIFLLVASNIGLWIRLAQSESQEFRTVILAGTANASGLLVIGHDGNLGTLVVDDLPVLDENHQYQLWLIKDGQRTSGGIFSTDAFGYGALAIGAPDPLKSYQAVGITIEPVGGSPAPTGEKVMGGDL